MTRSEMLKRLSAIPHPITENLVVYNDGCEFNILTREKGFICLVGGRFPLNGPLQLSHAQHEDFMRTRSLQGDDSFEEAIEKHIHTMKRRVYLINLLYTIWEDVVNEVLRIDWPPEKPFYVFSDMGRCEAAIFPDLESAYAYFLKYFTQDIVDRYPENEGASWDSMDDEELTQWYEMLGRWRAKGSKRLPPRSWLGAQYDVSV